MRARQFGVGMAAAAWGLSMAGQAGASVLFNINANGIGSYSIDGCATVPDNGTLRADPSSNIGVNVLTFAFPVGQGNGPGDVLIYNPANTTVVGDFRFTDSAGDISGVHNVDRIIFYSTGNVGNPADTGLPSNAGTGSSIRVVENSSAFVQFVAGTNVYNIQGVGVVPEPSSLALCGVVTAFGLAAYGWRRRKVVAA